MNRLFAARGRLLAITALTAVVVAAGLGFAAAAAGGQTYTGCLQAGSLSNIAIGAAPAKACPKNATQISWNQTGPQGEQGPPGQPGQPGQQGEPGDDATASLDALAGSPCVRANGADGSVAVAVGADNAVVLTCAAPADWCANNTPTVGPHMTAICDEDRDTVFLACDHGWTDQNDEPSDGCETGSAPLPFPGTDAMAQAVARSLFGGGQEVILNPVCGADLTLGCVNGEPADPASVLRLIGVSTSGVSPIGQPYRLDISAEVTMKSVESIPFRVTGINCVVDIDTAAFGSPTIEVAHSLVLRNLEDTAGVPNRLVLSDIQVLGITGDDYRISGDLLCTLGSVITPGLLTSMLENVLAERIGSGVCVGPEPDLYVPCPAQP